MLGEYGGQAVAMVFYKSARCHSKRSRLCGKAHGALSLCNETSKINVFCWFRSALEVWFQLSRSFFRHLLLAFEAMETKHLPIPGLQRSLQVFVETHIPQQLPFFLRNLRAQVWSRFVLRYEGCIEVNKSESISCTINI